MTIHAKVTSKGQVTLPKEVREAEGIGFGDTIAFQRNANGRIEIVRTDTSLSSLRGYIQYDGPKLSSDDIVEIVRASREGKGREVLEKIKRRRA
jgi:antitoxin PrlF